MKRRASSYSFVREALLLSLPCLISAAPAPSPRAIVGETFAITRTVEIEERSGDGLSNSSSTDRDTIVERVVAVRDGGLELEYDLPSDATADDRKSQWTFPARIFRASDGKVSLLDRPALEARVEQWLKAGKLSRQACGHWVFTWNAFKIECDPGAALRAVAGFDLRAIDPTPGALFRDENAVVPVPLVARPAGHGSGSLVADLKLDPEVVRRASVDQDVILGEITGKKVSVDSARLAHADDEIAGTISVSIETDASGAVRQLTKVTEMTLKSPGHPVRRRKISEIVERRVIGEKTNPRDPRSVLQRVANASSSFG